MNRREFLTAACGSAVSAGTIGCSGARATEDPRGVLLIIADDLGRELGCYGNRTVMTPNIDRLAADGTLFANSFANVSSCSAARSVIFSGRHSHQTGQYGLAAGSANFHSFPSLITLPALLGQAGIARQLIGKFHLQPRAVYPFDAVSEGFQGNRDVRDMALAAEAFLQAHRETDFFLTVSFVDPHRDAEGGFGNAQDYLGVSETRYNPDALEVPAFLDDNAQNRQELAGYYQSVSRLDQGVGMLLQALSGLGLDRSTLVLFVSDNGPGFLNAKTNLYDAGIATPLVLRAPGAEREGVRSTALAGHSAVTPTVCDWLGLDPPAGTVSGSLLPLVGQQAPAQGWDRVFASHNFHGATECYPMRMLRTPRFKLIHNLLHRTPYPLATDIRRTAMWREILAGRATSLAGRSLQDYFYRPRFELFDLQADPRELANLATEPAFAQTASQLKAELRQWMRDTADPWLTLLTGHEEIDQVTVAP